MPPGRDGQAARSTQNTDKEQTVTFMQTVATEKIKQEIISYSIFLIVMLYFFEANIKLVGAFIGATIYVILSLFFSAYLTYRKNHINSQSDA